MSYIHIFNLYFTFLIILLFSNFSSGFTFNKNSIFINIGYLFSSIKNVRCKSPWTGPFVIGAHLQFYSSRLLNRRIFWRYYRYCSIIISRENHRSLKTLLNKINTFCTVPTPGDVEAVLLVNIKGCGYPPIVDCENFTREMGYEGAKFPCHYSRVNGSIVMANYNREAQVTTIIHFFAAPFVVTLATSVALCVMHCDCRCSPPPRHSSRGIRRGRGNDLR